MYPGESLSTTFSSQSVRGIAPAYISKALAGTFSWVQVLLFWMVRDSQWSTPSTARTLELSLREIFFVAAIWFSKYCDMVAERELPRTSIVTRRANFEKYIAACPAEFAPPTM